MKQNKTIFKIGLLSLAILGVKNIFAQTTSLGTGAGTAGTTNVNLGTDAGKVNTANYNVFLGFNSGKTNTTGTNNLFGGYQSGLSNTTASNNCFLGFKSGISNTTGAHNSFIGSQTGVSNTTGTGNTILGSAAALFNTLGSYNCFIGHVSGYKNTSGSYNVGIGTAALVSNLTSNGNSAIGYHAGEFTTGENNVFLGMYSGNANATGIGNTYIGAFAGSTSLGTGNAFLGFKAGENEQGNNKLYIANSNTISPLIYGEFDNKKIVLNAKVGINTSTFPTTVGTANVANYNLFVKGGILTEEVRVRTGWADYVFNQDYKLMPLNEVESFIYINKHLPNVPTTKEVNEQGLSLGDIAKIQQEKIEELTLYLIVHNPTIVYH